MKKPTFAKEMKMCYEGTQVRLDEPDGEIAFVESVDRQGRLHCRTNNGTRIIDAKKGDSFYQYIDDEKGIERLFNAVMWDAVKTVKRERDDKRKSGNFYISVNLLKMTVQGRRILNILSKLSVEELRTLKLRDNTERGKRQ